MIDYREYENGVTDVLRFIGQAIDTATGKGGSDSGRYRGCFDELHLPTPAAVTQSD